MSAHVLTTPEELRTLIREAVAEALSAKDRGGAVQEVLTSEQAGKLLGLHPKVVIGYVTSKGLPGQRLGRIWRFRRTELLEWMARQGKAA